MEYNAYSSNIRCDTIYINKHQTLGKAITEMGLQAIKMSQNSRLQTTEL